jgi:hypothetical protein
VVVLHAVLAGQSVALLQPHAPVGKQAWPIKLAVQSTHAPPLAPHSAAALPIWQLLPSQQPPLQFCELEHAPEHWCVVVLHAVPLAQSAVTLQPHAAPPMHAWPVAFIEQSTHAVPPLPQKPAAVPALQVPTVMPFGIAQQPLAHGEEAVQPEPQVCVVMSHAEPGQSAAELHPHWPITHACPLGAVEQSTHASPLAPQLDAPVPTLQLPPEQQPPLHACDAEQLVVHRCVVVLHAVFIAQSPVALQPHAPPPAIISHTVPLGLAAQLAHAPPPAPHAPAEVPATHEPPEQQPPLHSCVAVQVMVHRWND